ncbi:MAG: FdtA/QdtA family cupin domain-containing protein [Ferroplasma sp.]|uniref:sugar 3,4-ketoisomerase n=1 Tax=Ferroplasma sp. TaxID=2591003 RepID=UPI0028159F4B|nr:FdtA/QdtA family cupin domain-containing protein [Ferroplasma sp.]WMT50652.1 MAG: FdtA/QdtA family cupin domain-containing protein [Ferroplasma sp.]
MSPHEKVIKYFSAPHIDERGILTVITDNIPIDNFEIKRVYYVKTSKKNVIRGGHAHYRQTQILFNISGRLEIELYNSIENKKLLLTEYEGIIISPLIWINIRSLTNNSLYMVLADGEYNENEYIRDKDKFMELISSDN